MTNNISKVPLSITQEVLLSILSKPAYRAQWMPYAQRQRGSLVNQRAVATFIAYHLSDETGTEVSVESLKDRVSRALTGYLPSDSTLQLFASAFGFTLSERQELRQALSADTFSRRAISTISADEEEPPDALERARSDYTSLSTIMICHTDREGLLTSIDITEVIQADRDHVTRILPRFEAPQADFNLLEGGQLQVTQAPEKIKPHGEDNTLWELVIRPPSPIRKEQIHQVRYRIDIDPSEDQLIDNQNCITLGPFEKARYNFTLVIDGQAPLKNMVKKIWGPTIDESELIDSSSLPDQSYHSLSLPIIQDTIVAYQWEHSHSDS
ncbi:hypothetical protein [Rothia sp. P5766]|uniref:hypothetical protein n=1 Tax=Rothia sp. P5766 TaxID=3402656 RepID=UPI003ADDD505